MARIAKDELEKLKTEIDLAALVRSKGVELKPHGKDLIGLCPFHNDTSPSLIVTPNKNLWHCLGACQTGGDVIAWMIKAEGVSFRHAVELLRDGRASRLVTPGKISSGRSTIPRLPSPVEISADDQTLLRQVVDYYHERLKQTPAALAYFEKRGIKSEEALNQFKLGFADRSLGLRLPMRNRKEGAEIRERLCRLGIFRQSGHEHFTGSVVIPVMDEHGVITELYGRKINDKLRPGTPYHLYLPGPHRGIWNPMALKADEIILCESLIDALTFWVNGFRNVTTSYGIEGFTEELFSGLLDNHVKKVYIAYDRDEAGEKAAEKLAEKLIGEGLECCRVQFPRNMDANSYACKLQPAEKSLRLLINSAVWMGKKAEGDDSRLEHAQISPPLITNDKPPSPPPAAKEGNEGLISEDREEVSTETLPDTSPFEQVADNLEEKVNPPVASHHSQQPIAAKEEKEAITQARTRINVPTTIKGEDIQITLGDRVYRIRGMNKNLSFDAMKVNVRISAGERYHIDTLDLYNARHRTAFINTAAEEVACKQEVIKRDIGRVLLKLEELQEKRINEALKPTQKEVTLTDHEREEALAMLRDPKLLERILADFEQSGLVGERTNVLVGYLSAISRKLDEPLAVIIQSSSAAGKSSLMDAVLAFIPEEDRVKYTAMTGQSLFYMGETELAHKTLAISEEEGAERASYAIKTMQSEKSLRIASTGKDPKTGRLITHEYEVQGPTQIMLTTTSVEVDEELQNRCLVLTVNEDRQQTQAIHQMQRYSQTLEGMLLKQDRNRAIKGEQNIQRLLKPLLVANPYAPKLTFLDSRLRTRRDHMKYLILIQTITLLHQYQRPVKNTSRQGKPIKYIETTLKDIEIANQLASEVLGRTLDELAPQTRRLLDLITKMATGQCSQHKMEIEDYRFTARQVREYTGWGNTQVKIHLSRLVEMEYLLIYKSLRGGRYEYELVYKGEGKDGKPFLMGLIDVGQLSKRAYDADWSGLNGRRSVPGRGLVGPQSAGGRFEENGITGDNPKQNADEHEKSPKTHIGEEKIYPSQLQANHSFIPLAAKRGKD